MMEMWARGGTPPEVYVPKLNRRLMAVPTPHGWIPFVPSNFFSVEMTGNTTLVMACLEGPNAAHIAVSKTTPYIRATTVRVSDRPEEMLIVELKSALLNISNGQVARLTGFGPV